jgi:hypothetical protein
MGLVPESVPRTRGIDVIAPSIDDRFEFARMQTSPAATEPRSACPSVSVPRPI